MKPDFYAVDVETANQGRHSICQIGIAAFRDGRLIDTWQSLVNPREEFHWINIGIHGIGPDEVFEAPCWLDVWSEVESRLGGAAVASHTAFDRGAISGACQKARLPELCAHKWIDTCWLARSAWPDLPNHKLPTLARHFGFQYRSHDALEDARIAGEILCLALRERGLTIEELLATTRPTVTGFPRSNDAAARR